MALWKKLGEKMTARQFKHFMNLYPPLKAAGIQIESIADDYQQINVALQLRWYNRNYVGTHFGGSLYAMTDPFYMLMFMQNLGRDYIVWDKSARIEYIRPGKGRVRACFSINPNEIDEIKERLKTESPLYYSKEVEIIDEKHQCVARVEKELYIRPKKA